MKIISGGQTGVDRGALDAALECGFDLGGWCPKGRKAEDGIIPDKYPLEEMPKSGYRQRTKKNVHDSDGTVIIYFKYPMGGTELTIQFCIKAKKPYLLIDAEEINSDRAAERISEFITEYDIAILNVAGPREGRDCDAYKYCKNAISCIKLNMI